MRAYLAGLLADPNGKPSSARHAALCFIPLAYLAVLRGAEAGTVAAIISGGVVALITRTKSSDTTSDSACAPAAAEAPAA